ncbi:hypothetical protein [Bradyrhizobium brasilense]|uniref:CN hydrolase domain-containing protein n=1 Tax=Bradyrhizobium brasilense TaxID=1419277 RepID=A0ABY8JC32_9BRAD|nr:hypothetical protein [Bradyrhizobium brasilense]WFU62678.1 hypothetical protein QA636_35400 [Bradyrhizobium brasilense]
MTSVATEFVVLDFIKLVLPDGTNGKASWKAVCEWPPDLFAAMAAIAERSGLYSEPTFTSYWVEDRFYPKGEWIKETCEIGRKWATTGRPPKKVQASWRLLVTQFKFSRIDDDDEEWRKIVFWLLAIADEASSGIGFSVRASESRQVSDQGATTLIQFVVYSDYQVWRQRWETDRSAIGGDVLPYLPHSLCIGVRPEIACVQPKTSAPTVGCTLRSLTHHLALLPSIANVTTHWHIAHERGEESHAFNLLLVPFPYHIPGQSFIPVPGKSPGTSNNKVFKLDPDVWMQGTTPAQFAKFLTHLLDAARPEMQPINAVVLPEIALPLDFAESVARILARTRRLDLFVTGVVTGQGHDARNSAAIYRFVNGLLIDRSFQSKHHRWGLDDGQIRRYHLGHVLDPDYKWWERIDVSHRECHVMLFRANATLSVLICEDLARYDPVLTVMNAIGPNLVIALLMDGPQLEHRWPGRYATVLADDPGSAVLTLTSLGMVARSSMPADPPSREIALWKEPTGKAKALRLPKGDHALLLTLTSRLIEQHTLDGRGDGGATVHFALGAAHPVRHPGPLPDWLGPIP